MMLQKSRSARKAECEKPAVRVFAWTPKNLSDGSLVWLGWVWKRTYWAELPWTFRTRVNYTKEKP